MREELTGCAGASCDFRILKLGRRLADKRQR